MGTRGPISRNGAGTQHVKNDGCEERQFADSLSELTFEQLIESCQACGDLKPQDGVIVALLWTTIQTFSRLNGELSDRPLCDQKDSLVQLAKFQTQIAAMAGRFGMSPSDRIRLGIQEPPPVDEESWFAKRQRMARELGID